MTIKAKYTINLEFRSDDPKELNKFANFMIDFAKGYTSKVKNRSALAAGFLKEKTK